MSRDLGSWDPQSWKFDFKAGVFATSVPDFLCSRHKMFQNDGRCLVRCVALCLSATNAMTLRSGALQFVPEMQPCNSLRDANSIQ